MSFFRNNTKKLIERLKNHCEYYSQDLDKDITDLLTDLKMDYEETSSVAPEFQAYVNELKGKLDKNDVLKLEEFSKRIAKVNRSAKKGVEAMVELSYHQRKLSAQTIREYENLEYIR